MIDTFTILIQLLGLVAFIWALQLACGVFRGLRGDEEYGHDIGFLGGLIPIAASLIGGLIGKKGKKKEAEAQRQAEGQQAENERRQAGEARYGSPDAESRRLQATMRLGRLYGLLGGREKAPPSLVKHLQSLRSVPTYAPGTYTKGDTGIGGGWGSEADLAAPAGKYFAQKEAEKRARGE